jgi:uncharacterized coiled-coil DUF342 family protein
MLPAILDWLGWERLTQTKKRHDEIMAILEDTLAQVKDLRLDIAKVRKENADLRLVLETRITNLEKLLEGATANPETIAALAAEVAGARKDLQDFDADVPDAAPPA